MTVTVAQFIVGAKLRLYFYKKKWKVVGGQLRTSGAKTGQTATLAAPPNLLLVRISLRMVMLGDSASPLLSNSTISIFLDSKHFNWLY